MFKERKLEAVLHGVAIWTLSGALLVGLMMFVSRDTAVAVRLITAPILALVVATAFFSKYEEAHPLMTATAFAGTVALLDAILLAGIVERSPVLFAQPLATWFVYVSIAITTWASGAVMVTPRASPRH
jgi:hypothetical protein